MRQARHPLGVGRLWAAIVLALLGIAALALPWVYSPALYRGEPPSPLLQNGTHTGLESWHGLAVGAVCASLFLLLLSGLALKPNQPPLWRAVPLMLGGILVLVFSGMLMVTVRDLGEAEKVPLTIQAGVYVELGIGVGFLILAALEARRLWSKSLDNAPTG
jgi:hypothetical protein